MKFAVIWDMDGVLIDSAMAVFNSFKTVLNKHGINYTYEEHKNHKGRALHDSIKDWNKLYNTKILREHFDLDAWKIERVAMKKLVLNSDLLNLLKELKSKDVPMGVGTSSGKVRADFILKDILHIREYFRVIITSEDVKEHKPNPQVFLAAAKKLNVEPEKCVVI